MRAQRYCLIAALLAAIALLPAFPGPGSPLIGFSDVAASAGIRFRHVSGAPEKPYILEAMGGGVAWIDYNRDGWPDLYLVNGGRWQDLSTGKRTVSNALYRNNGDGTFTDVTRQAGVDGRYWGMGVAVGDYDNDGWPDLYVCNYGQNVLYRNNGNGTFSDVTRIAGVGDPRWSSSAAFGDFDRDGWLDLYVANYLEFDSRNPPPPACDYRGIKVFCGPRDLIPAASALFRNNRDGTFTDVTAKAHVDSAPAYSLGVVWFDYDNDGFPDIFVANDSMPNYLFHNNRNGTFSEVGVPSGTAYSDDGKEQAGMGIAVGDYDRDGFQDILVTHFSDDYDTLYRNLANGLFRDMSYSSGIALPTWRFLSWGAEFFDFDNDGWEDLFIATGHVYPQMDRYRTGITYRQRKLVFHNLGNRKFSEEGAALGEALGRPTCSRGAAVADYDNDGDLDVAVNNLDDHPSLFRNDGGHRAGHWLILSLEGVETNRSAIGTRVTLDTGSGKQIREVRGGSSYQSSSDLRLHFGLGGNAIVGKIQVAWGRGGVQKFQNLPADSIYHLREGGQPTAIQLKRSRHGAKR